MQTFRISIAVTQPSPRFAMNGRSFIPALDKQLKRTAEALERELGRAPTTSEIAALTGFSTDAVAQADQRGAGPRPVRTALYRGSHQRDLLRRRRTRSTILTSARVRADILSVAPLLRPGTPDSEKLPTVRRLLRSVAGRDEHGPTGVDVRCPQVRCVARGPKPFRGGSRVAAASLPPRRTRSAIEGLCLRFLPLRARGRSGRSGLSRSTGQRPPLSCRLQSNRRPSA